MPELRALIHDTPERIEAEVNGERIALDYHPARVTPLWIDDLMGSGDKPLLLARVLAGVLSGWDVVENGKPLPLTEEVLASLPLPVLGAFAAAIGEASAGGEEGNGSPASLGPKGPDSTTPNTTNTHPNSNDTSPLLSSTG